MKKIFIMLVIVLCAACGTSPTPESSLTDRDRFRSMVQAYREDAPKDSEHWLSNPKQCDALLFFALHQVALGERSDDIWEFEKEPGKFARRPDIEKCRTFTSRDMLTGLFVYLYEFREVEAAKRVYQYAKEHNYFMGDANVSGVDDYAKQILTPNMMGTLARLIHALDGTEYPERFLPRIRGAEEGYEAHLGMLTVYLESQFEGDMGLLDERYLRRILEKAPNNVLALALLSRYGKGAPQDPIAVALRFWPQERLPTAALDWTEEWRTQRRDDDPGLKPNPDDPRVHSGGDLLFVAKILGF